MTSKERVLAALNHQQPDRVPLDLGGINNTCMHELIEEEFKQRLGLTDNGYNIKARSQRVVIPDKSVVEYLGVDTCSIYINEVRPWIDNGDGTFTDMWGIMLQKNPDGLYYNRISNPLKHIEKIEELDEYILPEPTAYMLEGLSELLDENADKCCILEGLEEPMFGLPSWLRRNDNFYVDLLINEELCDALLRKMLEYYKKLLNFIMEPLGDRIDIIKVADDLGAQDSLIMSPDTFRDRIKPYMAELFSFIKKEYNKKILLHCCGAIRPIIPDLIEIGVDALNPVQISAAGMDPKSLKAEFGDKLTFWGGGVDTQAVLNYGSPEDVRKQVKENIEIFKQGGGFVFAQVHNIQPGVPFENIKAMYDTYNEYAKY